MSQEFENLGAWVFSPYCFCDKQPWLVVNDIRHIGGDGDAGDGGGYTGVASLPDLSDSDSALLAALLTALAVFLFLLFLLLCLLCPFGVCCGKKGCCCGLCAGKKDDVSKSKMAARTISDSGSGSVNLTAVDMKIPRPWTERQGGFSDSELEKKHYGKWDEADGDGVYWWGSRDYHGKVNNGFQGDDFVDGRWFSSHDLDSVYGGKGSWRKTNDRKEREMLEMNEYYRGTIAKDGSQGTSMRHRRSSYSDVENLMTPSAAYRDVISGYGSVRNQCSSGSYVGRERCCLHGNEENGMASTYFSSQKRGDTMNEIAEITMNGFSHEPPIYDSGSTTSSVVLRAAPPSTSQGQMMETATAVTSATGQGGEGMLTSLGVAREGDGEIISTTVTRAYKRTVEETTTTLLD